MPYNNKSVTLLLWPCGESNDSISLASKAAVPNESLQAIAHTILNAYLLKDLRLENPPGAGLMQTV